MDKQQNELVEKEGLKQKLEGSELNLKNINQILTEQKDSNQLNTKQSDV